MREENLLGENHPPWLPLRNRSDTGESYILLRDLVHLVGREVSDMDQARKKEIERGTLIVGIPDDYALETIRVILPK